MKHCNIPIFVPHIGCPNDCVFCNQKKITGQSDDVTPEKLKEITDLHLSYAGSDKYIEIAFFGGSFTGIPILKQTQLLEAANKYLKEGKINGIRLSTRPDYISIEILELLKKYGVTAVELGVQSFNDDVLRLNERGHSSEIVKQAAMQIRNYDFELGLQMMTGMYGSSFQNDIDTAHEIINLKPDTTRIYPTMVLEGTKLETLYNAGKYIPPTLEYNVELCSIIYKMFLQNNVRVIRIGLQSTDTICEKGSIVAGAYHSSFGELVMSRIKRDELEKMAENTNEHKLTVYVNSGDVSKTIGNKRQNIKYIKDKYNIDIEVKINEYS